MNGSATKTIGTHNGTFHCDEVMACFMLKLLPEYKDSEIVRSRDPAKLDACDIVVDVGGTFDAKRHRYDHHQRTFGETMTSLSHGHFPWSTKLSSAGLVYYHFGQKILAHLLNTKQDDKFTELVFRKIYENLMEEIDGIDNGIDVADERRYIVSTNLSSRIGRCNPKWNDAHQDEQAGFQKALQLVEEEFMDRVSFYRDSWWPARSIVEKSLLNRFNVHSTGKIVMLENGGCPWKDHLFSIEEELKIEGEILYVLYPDPLGQWRVQCVPNELGSFANRKSLPESWRGIRDNHLSELSGIEDCVFVHASGFIGGNKTKAGALEMATQALTL